MSSSNKQIVQQMVDEIINEGKLELIDSLFSPAYTPHDPSNPDRPGGIEGAKFFIGMLHSGLTDHHYIVEDMTAEDDRVFYRWTLTGTHSGDLMGIPATGNKINFSGMDSFRLENAKIVESWVVADAMTMLQQLGVLPPMGPPPG